MRNRLAWGAALWAVRPVYVAIELAVAGLTTGSYSVVDDTVSDLGALSCSADFCSPAHALMNGTFMGVGALLAGGALLLAPRTGRSVTTLLVVSGLSSVATGFAPVDVDGRLHALAATPLFVCQPVALVVLGRRLRASRPRTSRALVVTGVITAAGAVGFIAGGDTGAGAWERLALWPVIGALAAAGVATGGGVRRSAPGQVAADLQ
ncbi:DUF998 domain-containing protein [Nocardioides sp. HDW12B]|uniref:DUF998 domain-containing protein n=1 Tax=Nocardioides sp. HDW12B TaxID=2714939 RepID=UPI001409943E|nr:DUF998 domain-containing protein [Nocardioides sp. HDW12B]QIK65687.1 DUF998 domain-containing protein [Nocardioides sp. HDW12B]